MADAHKLPEFISWLFPPYPTFIFMAPFANAQGRENPLDCAAVAILHQLHPFILSEEAGQRVPFPHSIKLNRVNWEVSKK